jgi:tetratricopeptide (TPR) repeat protein
MSALAGLTASQALALGDSLAIDEQFDDAVDAYAAGLAVLVATPATTAGADAPTPEAKDSEAPSTTIADGSETAENRSAVERFRLLSHRSDAFYRLARFAEAVDDARAAQGMNVAGLRAGEREAVGLRLGKALYQLGKYDASQSALEQVVRLAELNGRAQSTASVAAKDWIARCVEELEPPMLEPARPSPPPPPPLPAPAGASKPPAPAPTSAATITHRIQPPKYQYYQSDKVLTISILEPNVRPEHLVVEYADSTTIRVVLKKQGQDFVVVSGHLYDEVDVDQCKAVIKDEKVLIKLKKINPNKEWYDLFDKKKKKKTDDAATGAAAAPAAAAPKKSVATAPAAAAAAPSGAAGIPRPYATTKNWDKIEKEVAEEEEKEIPEGDAAAMKLFQQIYAGASEETRRAMVKSYQTSGGTVLSTNWDEVSKKDYEKERTAPKGQEWKNWEGDKLA